jgi:hypothetical protein
MLIGSVARTDLHDLSYMSTGVKLVSSCDIVFHRLKCRLCPFLHPTGLEDLLRWNPIVWSECQHRPHKRKESLLLFFVHLCRSIFFSWLLYRILNPILQQPTRRSINSLKLITGIEILGAICPTFPPLLMQIT